MTVVRNLALLMSFGSLAPPAASKTFSRRVPVKLPLVVLCPAWNETFTVSGGSALRSSRVNERGVPTRPLTATSGENVDDATASTGAAAAAGGAGAGAVGGVAAAAGAVAGVAAGAGAVAGAAAGCAAVVGASAVGGRK